MTELMKMLKDAGVKPEDTDHHATDLYVFVTDASNKAVEEYKKTHTGLHALNYEVFRDQITGKPMYDFWFQFDGDWNNG